MSVFVSIPVEVCVGVGGPWRAAKTITLPSAPHTGDFISMNGKMIYCERVIYFTDHVRVESAHFFSTQEDAERYFDDH